MIVADSYLSNADRAFKFIADQLVFKLKDLEPADA